MMSSTFGAPLGGTTVIGQKGFESLAFSLITPPNGAGGGGSCLPSMVVVALGEPGTPVICCAEAGITHNNEIATVGANPNQWNVLMASSPSGLSRLDKARQSIDLHALSCNIASCPARCQFHGVITVTSTALTDGRRYFRGSY